MNWEAIGAIGDFVGGIAVVITLLYLVVQLRQNTRTIGVSAYAQLCSQLSNLSYTIAANPNIAKVWNEGLSNPAQLSGDAQHLFSTLAAEFYFAMEDMFRLSEQDLIDADTWRGQYENSGMVLLSPGGAQFLSARRGPIAERFRRYIAENPPPTSSAA